MADVQNTDPEAVRELMITPTPRELPASVFSSTPDVHGASMRIERARDAYKAYSGIEEKPNKLEVLSWYLYELCSHFIHTVLIPIVFPLILTQIVSSPSDHDQPFPDWSPKSGVLCTQKETKLYHTLTHKSIRSKYSPLEWTSISWAIGLALASPLLGLVSIFLDHGYSQPLIAIVSTAIGAIFCLPTGFFRNVWIFPPYIAAIVAASVVATACHTRHLGLMVRGFTGPTLQKSQFQTRRGVSGWISLYAAAAGSLGSAVMSSFTYHMLRDEKPLTSLWIVSIFSGIKWLCGTFHFLVTKRPCISSPIPSSKLAHFFSIFKFPHAVGTLVAIFLSSFTTMSIFTGGVLYLVGQLCFKPKSLLYFWLTYFMFPLLSLPLMQPLQHVIKCNAVKMQVLGFFLSATTSGFGFYFRDSVWEQRHVLLFAAIQSTATGLLHAFSRVLLMDCSPRGKEGAFAAWYSWTRGLGMCAGFAVASGVPGSAVASFGVSFCSTMCGILILIFGNISDSGGAKAAGHVRDDIIGHDQRGSPVDGLDTVITAFERQEHVHGETVPLHVA